MKCQKRILYREMMRFGYDTFISVEVRRYDAGDANDVVIQAQVVEDDNSLVNTREVLNGDGYNDAALQRKGIKAFDALKAEFGERLGTVKAANSVPLEF